MTQKQLEKLLKNNFEDKIPYIECNEGWFQLIANCHADIYAYDPDYKILQIKEKFAGLRYYFDTDKDRTIIWKIIESYEALSFKTCEDCGKEGCLCAFGSWYSTLCKKCFDKRAKSSSTKGEFCLYRPKTHEI